MKDQAGYKSLIFFCIFIFSSLFFCSSDEYDRLNKLLTHPAKKLDSFEHIEGNLIDKIGSPNDVLMDYLMFMDCRKGIYKSYQPTANELETIKSVFKQIPRKLKEAVEDRIIGIYFVKNFLGSGLADWVKDENGNVYTFMVFNSVLLKQTATERITMRERSAFISEDSYKLTYNLGDVSAFSFIFYHELMHVYDYIYRATPGEKHLYTDQHTEKHAFTKGIWESSYQPVSKYDFPNRNKLHFYGIGGEPKIKISHAPQIYRHLERSPFVSIYGSMSFLEDFAEMGAILIHKEILRHPYEIIIEKDGKVIYRFDNPINRPYVLMRLKYIEKIFR